MKKLLHVLAIDDHVVVLEGYLSIFRTLKKASEISFSKAYNCKSGFEIIEKHKADPFDIAVIDYSIPNYPDKNLFSGEDLALMVRQNMPGCKVIVMTMHKEADIMGSILEKVKPDGFINKSDCTTDELIDGFAAIMAGQTFYSKTISDYLKMLENGIQLDNIDMRIMHLLAKGIKNKNLPKYIPLTASGIEKRKYRIKYLLHVEGDDEALINEARKRGYL